MRNTGVFTSFLLFSALLTLVWTALDHREPIAAREPSAAHGAPPVSRRAILAYFDYAVAGLHRDPEREYRWQWRTRSRESAEKNRTIQLGETDFPRFSEYRGETWVLGDHHYRLVNIGSNVEREDQHHADEAVARFQREQGDSSGLPIEIVGNKKLAADRLLKLRVELMRKVVAEYLHRKFHRFALNDLHLMLAAWDPRHSDNDTFVILKDAPEDLEPLEAEEFMKLVVMTGQVNRMDSSNAEYGIAPPGGAPAFPSPWSFDARHLLDVQRPHHGTSRTELLTELNGLRKTKAITNISRLMSFDPALPREIRDGLVYKLLARGSEAHADGRGGFAFFSFDPATRKLFDFLKPEEFRWIILDPKPFLSGAGPWNVTRNDSLRREMLWSFDLANQEHAEILEKLRLAYLKLRGTE